MKNKSYVQWLDERPDRWFWQNYIIIVSLSLISFFDFNEWKAFYDVLSPGHEHTFLWPPGAKEGLDNVICACIIPDIFRDPTVAPQNDGLARLIEWALGLTFVLVVPVYAAGLLTNGNLYGNPADCKRGAALALLPIFTPFIAACLFGRLIYWGIIILAFFVLFGIVVVKDSLKKLGSR